MTDKASILELAEGLGVVTRFQVQVESTEGRPACHDHPSGRLCSVQETSGESQPCLGASSPALLPSLPTLGM